MSSASKIVVLLFLFGMFSCESSDPVMEGSTVWDTGENQVDGYRIPGLIVSKQGTILAFAEERPKYGDADPKSMVVKRSTDEGKTWSDNIYIEVCDGSFWAQNKDMIFDEDKEKKEVWTNTAPIADLVTGKIFFFYALNEGLINGENLQRYTRVFYKTSDDDGLTWSKRVEVTHLLNVKEDGSPNKDENGEWVLDENGFPCDFLGRAFHMPGPGHGIQLSNGRLLLQVWNRKALGVPGQGEIPVEERRYGVSTLYSDDHGTTWKFGSAFGDDLNVNESRIVELTNGDVYYNGRYVPTVKGERNNHRATAISKDGGLSWIDIKIDSQFVKSNHCDAGLARMVGKDGNSWLVYSKNQSESGRKNLVVQVSDDDGMTWKYSRVVDEGPAMYSDLAVGSDSSYVYMIYETAKNSPVYFRKFNVDWLLGGN